MRKTLLTLLALTLAGSLLLTACGSGDSASNNAASPSGANSSTEATTPAPKLDNSIQFIKAADLSKLPASAKTRNDTVIFSLTDPSGAFTPHFHQTGYDGNVASVIFSPLVTVDNKGIPIPKLAKKWEISPDQLTYTFHLHEGLKFSDGSPLTAEDVAFTLTILHDKSYDGSTDIGLIGVKGGQAYKEGKAKSIEGIKVLNPQTVQITTEKVNATALLELGGYVLSKAYYGKDYKFGNLDYIKDLHSKPVGTGPYRFVKHLPGQEVRFVANEHYYEGKPAIENFIYKTTEGDIFQFVETGGVDYSGFSAKKENLDKLQQLGFLNVQIHTASSYGFIQFNHNQPHLKDKKVRQALTYGLDRKSIVEGVSQGSATVANIPASPISWAYTEEKINPYNYDPEKAKALLEEAGWKVGSDGIREKDGKPLTIRYLTSKSKDTDAFIAMAKENYTAIGVKFEPEQFADYNSMSSKVDSGDYDLASFSTPMLTDPHDGVERFSTKEAKGYSNPKVDQLIQEGVSTLDIEKRKEVYKKLYQELNEDLPFIFYNYRKLMSAHNGRIEGLEISPFRGIATSLPTLKLK
ncbi:ABC transporter substrate-binding protein [Paenibacillus sp. 481]|uniref:ABC transporter substrate-binding protein n=1 Tax=Paenibacillus sp. 481 TaxID=2835869 RepID=UPI001E3FC262|nr:ABC transporter substrate-binding protein [Paenibacillus sp. 481]UHA75519.1 ABC transporter substrate-binding protein [Paenibacillus sp. 481]